MSRKRRYFALGAAGAALALVLRAGAGNAPEAGRCAEAGRAPRIHPDYAGVVLPPNIAPLNFAIDEPGKRFVVRLTGPDHERVEVVARNRQVRIPLGAWRDLLFDNAGQDLSVDVFAQDARGGWTHFQPIRNHVAREKIDGTLVYRLLKPAYNLWSALGIYQRDLTSFEERPILRNTSIDNACLNCHTPLNRRADTFLFHIRVGGGNPAMVVARGGGAQAVETRAPQRPGAATYCSWHPSGKLIAFSANKIRQFFHTAGTEPRDVVDLDSGVAIYWVDSGKIEDVPVLNEPRLMETFPTWAPDGRALYFSRAAMPWARPDVVPMAQASRVRYDLVRVSFDIKTGAWGKAETVLAAKDAGKSILEPRVSPDGKFLLCTMCDYGAFPVMQQHSDLYLIDLTRKGFPCRRVEEASESLRDSWHTWSGNSRWVVFSRKRERGVVARPYLRYIDAEGKPAKALVMPQEDPTYYDRCLETYNAPELVDGWVKIPEEELARAANSSAKWPKPAKH